MALPAELRFSPLFTNVWTPFRWEAPCHFSAEELLLQPSEWQGICRDWGGLVVGECCPQVTDLPLWLHVTRAELTDSHMESCNIFSSSSEWMINCGTAQRDHWIWQSYRGQEAWILEDSVRVGITSWIYAAVFCLLIFWAQVQKREDESNWNMREKGLLNYKLSISQHAWNLQKCYSLEIEC